MRIILNGSVSTVKRLRVLLGTLVAIEAMADAPALAAPAGPPAGAIATAGASIVDAAIERAFEAIGEIDRVMHPTASGSDLARINDASLHAPVRVHSSVGKLLNLAKRINALTDGVFDPCTPAQPGRLIDLSVSDDETEIVCRQRVALDFGGFAKGYAVDCAIEALIAGGCTAGLVNAGGDLRVFGPGVGPVFVRGLNGELTQVEINDAALAVSDATAQQTRPPEHQGYYVRSPAASVPAIAYAAVIANTAVIADALAKCVLLCPPSVASHALREFSAVQLQ